MRYFVFKNYIQMRILALVNYTQKFLTANRPKFKFFSKYIAQEAKKSPPIPLTLQLLKQLVTSVPTTFIQETRLQKLCHCRGGYILTPVSFDMTMKDNGLIRSSQQIQNPERTMDMFVCFCLFPKKLIVKEKPICPVNESLIPTLQILITAMEN